MRSFVTVAAVAAVLALSACKEEKAACTEADVQAKSTEMVTKMQELATKDPAKLAVVGEKATELQGKLAEMQNDPAKACEAIDEILKAME